MFIHLGGDVIVPKEEVVAIIDLESASKASSTREFLSVAKEEGFVINICQLDRAKSFIVTEKNVYYSPISSATLLKRGSSIKALIKTWEVQ